MALNSILATPVSSPPPKPASSHSSSSASHSSFGADNNSDGSQSTQQSSSSSNSASTNDNGNTTRNQGKNSSSSNSASSNQAQNSSASSQSQQSSAASQTQSANAASNGKNGAAQPSKAPGTSFLQALAQSQADAQDSVSATADVDPQTITGKGKGKAAKDDSSTDSSAASFGFLSQSLVAAMAGIQQPSAVQGASDGDDSVDGVSLSSGTSAQSMVASLMQSTADELKAAGGDASKLDSDSTAAGNTAANASAASSFQSHLGISSQLQTSASTETANTQVNTPVGASGFADEVGDKITWMAHQGVQSASLKMTPENMGPVEVKISMQDGSATVAINAAHADTRAALEQALPRLREMFSTQGLNLTDASVSQQFAQKQQPQKQSVSAVGSAGGVSDEPDSAVVSLAAARLGLLDTYA